MRLVLFLVLTVACSGCGFGVANQGRAAYAAKIGLACQDVAAMRANTPEEASRKIGVMSQCMEIDTRMRAASMRGAMMGAALYQSLHSPTYPQRMPQPDPLRSYQESITRGAEMLQMQAPINEMNRQLQQMNNNLQRRTYWK